MKKLGIPIERITTRHFERRVVWILCIAVLGCFLGTTAFSLLGSRDMVSSHAPEETVYTLQFKKTSKTVRRLSRYQGTAPLNPVMPWTINDLLQRSERGFALHMDEKGLVGFTIDAQLTQNDLNLAQQVGSTVQKGNTWTTIALDDAIPTASRSAWRTGYLFPWTQGYFIDQDGQSSSFSMNKRGITIKNVGLSMASKLHIALKSEAEPFALVQLSSDAFQSSLATAALTPIPYTQKLQTALQTNGGELLFAKDDEGISYTLFIPTTSISLDELALIAKEMISRTSLTTTALTSETGEEFEELRANDEHLDSTIRAEEDFTYILSTNGDGSVIRATKTQSGILFSNRDISAEISENLAKSTCLMRAHSYIKIPEFLELFAKQRTVVATNEQQLFPIFTLSEISFSRHKTRLCW